MVPWAEVAPVPFKSSKGKKKKNESKKEATGICIDDCQKAVYNATHTLMDMRTELKAVPHAGLGFHFLRVPVGSHRILEVLKGKEAQSTRSRSAIRSK